MTEVSASTNRFRRRLSVFAVPLMLVLLLILVHDRSPRDVVEHVLILGVGPVLAAVVLAVLATVLLGWEFGRTYSLLGGRRGDRLQLMVEAAEVQLLNFLLPFSGSARRLSTAGRRHAVSASRLAGGLVVLQLSRAMGAVIFIIAGGVAASPVAAVGIVSTVLVVAGAVSFVWRGSRARGVSRWPARTVVALLPLGVVRLLLLSIRLGIIVEATGTTPDRSGLILAAGLSALAMAVPFLPSGIGLRESVLVAAAAAMGVTVEVALAVALADRGVMVAAGVVTLAIVPPARRVIALRGASRVRAGQRSPATE